MSNAFDLLHRKIQQAIWDQETKWDRLRPLQEDAIRAVIQGENHLILAAATASGKTEAAFLPVLSKLAENPDRTGVGAIYVGPLKALINDQFRRLEDLCRYADIPVHKWHGDVSANDKKKFREKPGGVLLITPESLESNFINYGSQLPRIYSNLEFVVIDELHAFLEGVRGIHLQSLLARLRSAAGVDPRMLGLSATLGDWNIARKFLDRNKPESVTVISPESAYGEKKVALRSYIESAAEQDGEEPSGAILDIADELARKFRRDSNLIFTNSRLLSETLADKIHQITVTEKWKRNPFLVHHGSISREIREDVEHQLKNAEKSGLPVTAFCTSTLEMGIDIGAARAVGQVGPAWTVNSLVQRMGRSGRGEGQSSILRGYTIDNEPIPNGDIEDRFFPNLLRFCALIELMIDRWVEPLDTDDWHLSTCIHQTLSILRQTGGTSADALYQQLCVDGAFHEINKPSYIQILRDLGKEKVIQQMAEGTLILAPDGELIVEGREFYAAFMGTDDFSVRYGEEEIGSLTPDLLPPIGEHLVLGGRRWKLIDIDGNLKTAYVERSGGYTKPKFSGGSGFIHNRIVEKMGEILRRGTQPPYLDTASSERLQSAQDEFRRLKLNKSDLIRTDAKIVWFPWVGTRALLTIVTAAHESGLAVDSDFLSISFPFTEGEADIWNFLGRLADRKFDAVTLASKLSVKQFQKFDSLVSSDLLDKANASRILELETAGIAARKALQSAGI